MLGRGLRVGLGTDSVASVSPLDLLAEARAARALAGLSAEAGLQLVTLSAARALGLEREIGSLAPGKWGDLAALDLGGPVDAARLADTVLSRGSAAVRLAVVGGREVFRSDQ
jgi:5-methylthioadenosine/S-adenosylhomocysteine deaminase